MYSIIFYKDRSGKQELKDYLSKLNAKSDKNSRINFNKIRDYIKLLQIHGTALSEPFVKHLEGEIWELRPLRNRILFFTCYGNNIILLSHFIKKTQKTPKKELEKAKRMMKDYIERSDEDEQGL